MRRVVRFLPLEIRAWVAAAGVVLLGALATPTLIKHINPPHPQAAPPPQRHVPELAPKASIPQQPGQSVNRASKAARETGHAAKPAIPTARDRAPATPQEIVVDQDSPAETGRASWYELAANTASGEAMDGDALTGAHPTLPIGSKVLVENLDNGRVVVVRINDRGPLVKGRIIDVSRAAAETLGMVEAGVARVRVSRINETVAGSKVNVIAAGAGR
jgi:rare lipoprotein A